MIIKAGIWNRLSSIEKMDLLVYHASQTELGMEYLRKQAEKEQKNKPLCGKAQGL